MGAFGGGIKSIQQGTISITSTNTTNTATITAVDTDKTILINLGSIGNEDNFDNISCRVEVTNTTTITATRGGHNTNTAIVGYMAVEFY